MVSRIGRAYQGGIIMRFITASLAVSVSLILLITGSAIAEDEERGSNDSLKGKFRLSVNKTCTDTATGSTVHLYFSGVTIYDGNGHATLRERGTIFFPTPPHITFEETANLTYQVRRNGSFIREGTFTATDGSYTLTGVKQVGQIDPDGSVLNLSGAIPPVLETLSFAGGGFSQRSCGASGTEVRIR
jgi:hypothetical protein